MTDHSVYKRFLSLVIALTVFFGIVVYVPSEEVLADVDNSNIELSDTVSVAGEDIIVGNGVYKILTKNGAAFTGLLNPNVESFTVPNTIKYLETTYKVSWIAQSALFSIGKTSSAKFYMRQLSDTGMVLPDKKAYIFTMRPQNKYDLPVGWVKLS